VSIFYDIRMRKIFEILGVTEKEQDLFLQLLQLGAQPASVIAKKVGVPRSTAYLFLENIKSSGLVQVFEHKGIKYFKSISPKEIPTLLQEKESRIQKAKNDFQEYLPQLEKMESTFSITPKVQFYEGKDAIRKMYKKIFYEKETLAFANIQKISKISPENISIISEHIQRNEGRAKELLSDSKTAREYKKKYQSPFHEIKILSKGEGFSSDMIIGKDTLYLFSYGENEITGTEIFNPDLAHSHRVLFMELWNRL
jgi:sugar-specific transcriptional regulator TrmB